MTLHHNDDSNQRSNDDNYDDDGPVTVIVTRKANKGKIREFEDWMEKYAEAWKIKCLQEQL